MKVSDVELSKLLIKSAVLDKKTLATLNSSLQNSQTSLYDLILEKDLVTDEKMGELVSQILKVPFVKLSKTTITEKVFNTIPERIARNYKVIPFAEGDSTIKLAMANPNSPNSEEIADLITRKTSKKVIRYFATAKNINETLEVYRKDLKKTLDELIKEEAQNAQKGNDEAPIIKIVDLIVTYAHRDRASDIHIEPEENDLLVRFRIDSVLYDVLMLDKKLHNRIVTRIKVLSQLRTDEHSSAQDGKIRMEVDGDVLDIRISIVPVTEGEKVMLRLLSSQFRSFSLHDLGMGAKDSQKITNAFNKGYGMILATGPTGSGKTTTIYSLLKSLNSRARNITTIEDPVEYRIKGVNQIQVNPNSNLTFADGLRSILRQDPNVIFVGEIRDSETAGITINAALTGHLVLSTLHTIDAARALPRIIDMDIEPFLVSSTVNVIIAQRLVRKICPDCKMAVGSNSVKILKDISKKGLTKDILTKKNFQLYVGKGCKSCNFTGYTGRFGVFEVIEESEGIRKMITST